MELGTSGPAVHAHTEPIYQEIVTEYPGTEDALAAQKQLAFLYIAWHRYPQADAAYQQLLAKFLGGLTAITRYWGKWISQSTTSIKVTNPMPPPVHISPFGAKSLLVQAGRGYQQRIMSSAEKPRERTTTKCRAMFGDHSVPPAQLRLP
jgi:hypothetical protein